MSAHVAGVMEGRVFVRCDNCHLRQFPSLTGACRKCHSVLADPDEPIEMPPAPEPEKPQLPIVLDAIDVAFAVKTLRYWRHWTQRQVSFMSRQAGSGFPRTYVSKLERGMCSPTLAQVDRLAAVFGISPRDFMALATIGQENSAPGFDMSAAEPIGHPVIPQIASQNQQVTHANG